MKGASASLARRRLISVLPQPVGPIIRMFLGVTSSRSVSGRRWRRQRLRKATATARFASFWPTICSSSAATMALGVRASVMSVPIGQRRPGSHRSHCPERETCRGRKKEFGAEGCGMKRHAGMVRYITQLVHVGQGRYAIDAALGGVLPACLPNVRSDQPIRATASDRRLSRWPPPAFPWSHFRWCKRTRQRQSSWPS